MFRIDDPDPNSTIDRTILNSRLIKHRPPPPPPVSLTHEHVSRPHIVGPAFHLPFQFLFPFYLPCAPLSLSLTVSNNIFLFLFCLVLSKNFVQQYFSFQSFYPNCSKKFLSNIFLFQNFVSKFDPFLNIKFFVSNVFCNNVFLILIFCS